MVHFLRILFGFIFLELSLISVTVGLHYHHQRPAAPAPPPPPNRPPQPPPNRPRPPPPPPRRPPPPPPRRPPPNTPGTTAKQTTTTTTTPAPEIEVELEEVSPAPNTTIKTPSTLRPTTPYKYNYPYGSYPYYNYYAQYPPAQQQYRQPYGQNHYYNQAQGYYYGNYSGQSSVAGQGQNPPTYDYVTNAPLPSPYPYYQNYPQNDPYSATQPPPPVHDTFNQQQNYPQQNYQQNQYQQGPPANPPYNYYGASVPPPTSAPYYPPGQANSYQQPPPQGNAGSYASQTLPPPTPAAQNNYYGQQSNSRNAPAHHGAHHQQAQYAPNNKPVDATYSRKHRTHTVSQQSASVHNSHSFQSNQQPRGRLPQSPPKTSRILDNLPPTPPANEPRPAQTHSHSRMSTTIRRQKTQPVNRRPLLDNQRPRQLSDTISIGQSSYPSDVNLPAPPTPLSESRYRQPSNVQPAGRKQTEVRYQESKQTISQTGPVKTVYIQTLERRRPEASVVESGYRKAPDNRLSEVQTRESLYMLAPDKTASVKSRNTEVRSADASYIQAADNTRRADTLTVEKRYVVASDKNRLAETINAENRYLRESKSILSPTPPGKIIYLKPTDKKPPVTITAEYNYLKDAEQKKRLPLENQLGEITQKELLLLLEKEKQRQRSLRKENPYLKALFSRNKKASKSNKQCPLYKFSVEKHKIEIHTLPGQCKIVIKLPKDGKGKAQVSYLARS